MLSQTNNCQLQRRPIANSQCHGGARSGMGLMELLVSLAIVAALLVAVAVGVDAAFASYQANQEQSTLMQQTRLGLDRMLSQIRRCDRHTPDSASAETDFAAGQTVTDTGIAMVDPSGASIIYRYDSTNLKLLSIIGGQEHVMLEGVQQFDVTLEPARSATSLKTGGEWDLLRRATIRIAVQTTANTAAAGESVGRQTLQLSGSAMPRKNCW